MSSAIDHLIVATPGLEAGIEHLENLIGVPAIAGGSHPGMGTCNALIGLGPECYLELIGPDPAQPDFNGTRPFGIDALEDTQLVGWAARRDGLSQFAQAQQHLGEVIAISRETTTGELLGWEMAFVSGAGPEAMSILPFFIDWGPTPHPAQQCSQEAKLTRLQLQHPRPAEVLSFLSALELDISVSTAPKPGICAFITCPKGQLRLDSKN